MIFFLLLKQRYELVISFILVANYLPYCASDSEEYLFVNDFKIVGVGVPMLPKSIFPFSIKVYNINGRNPEILDDGYMVVCESRYISIYKVLAVT